MAVVYKRRWGSVITIFLAIVGILVFLNRALLLRRVSQIQQGMVMGAIDYGVPVKISDFYVVSKRCVGDTFRASFYLRVEGGYPDVPGKEIGEYTLSLKVEPVSYLNLFVLPEDMYISSNNKISAVENIKAGGVNVYTFFVEVPPEYGQGIRLNITARLTANENIIYSGNRYKHLSVYIKKCKEPSPVNGEVPTISGSQADTKVDTNITSEEKKVVILGDKSDNSVVIGQLNQVKVCGCYNLRPAFYCQQFNDIDAEIRCSTFCKSRQFEYGEPLTCKDLEIIWK